MNTCRNHQKCRTILVLSMLVSCLFGFGQKKQEDTFDIHKASFFLPQPLPSGHYYSSISVLYVVTPKDWTLDNVTAPMFFYQGKYTLPKGFNLQAGLPESFYFKQDLSRSLLELQDRQNYVGLGWNVAWNFGVLNQFGFTTTLTGWEQQPSISFGHMFAKTAVTFRADLYWTNAL